MFMVNYVSDRGAKVNEWGMIVNKCCRTIECLFMQSDDLCSYLKSQVIKLILKTKTVKLFEEKNGRDSSH